MRSEVRKCNLQCNYLCPPPLTSPNNVEDQSPISKPNFNIVQGGGGRGKRIFFK